MTLPAIQTPQLPAHLQALAAYNVNDKVGALAAMAQPPSIRLVQGRFYISDAAGNEVALMSPFVDVVIVDMNKNKSKIYYEGAFEGNEGKPPTCFSDNGVGASSRATTPQSSSCQICPLNAWGSKISQMSGKPIPACGDYKKLAVILAAPVQTWANNMQGMIEPNGSVYMLRVPPASLKAFQAYVDLVKRAGVSLNMLTTRVQFDQSVTYPAILFAYTAYISEQLAPLVLATTDPAKADDMRSLTGENDTPWQGMAAQPQALPAPQLQTSGYMQPVTATPGQVLQASLASLAALNAAPPPVQQVSPPLAPPAPPVVPPPMPTATAPQAPPAGTAATGRGRGRPKKDQQAPAATAAPLTPPPVASAEAPSISAASPNLAPAPPVSPTPVSPPSPPAQGAVVMAPAALPPDLTALLKQSLGTPPAPPPNPAG